MTTSIKDTLSQHLATLKEQMATLQHEMARAEAALAAYESSDGSPVSSNAPKRFIGMAPYRATEILLHENGGRMNREALMQSLIAGGAAEGKKRGHHNLRISIDLNTQLGKLRQDGNDIVLTEAEPHAIHA